MSCLEEDNCDIDQLNAEIAKLQGMQHKYSMMEFESTKTLWLSSQAGAGEEASFYQVTLTVLYSELQPDWGIGVWDCANHGFNQHFLGTVLLPD